LCRPRYTCFSGRRPLGTCFGNGFPCTLFSMSGKNNYPTLAARQNPLPVRMGDQSPLPLPSRTSGRDHSPSPQPRSTSSRHRSPLKGEEDQGKGFF
jgi:hypothetical protein